MPAATCSCANRGTIPFAGHKGPIRDADWTRIDGSEDDGEILIVSADGNGEVRLWRSDGTLVRWFQAHRELVWTVRFSPDGKRILTSSNDGTARIWPVDLRMDTNR